ncbi:MAG: efflux RND transporter periplasmic adaptor subunit [Candidatus Firestonebacteria bacterium]
MKKYIAILGLSAVVCLCLAAGCGSRGGTEVNTTKVAKGELVVKVQSTGTVRSNSEAKLTTVASGRVSGIFAEENETVKKDKLLLQLDSTAQAEKDFRRISGLAGKGFMTSQAAEQAKEQWKNTFISAPFSGTIVKKFVEVGETLYGGTPAFMLADLNEMIVETSIDETDIGQVKIGQDSEIVLDAYKDAKLPGKVQFIAKSSLEVKEKGITYLVKVKLEKTQLTLRLGMTGDVYIKAANKPDVLMLPYTAIGDDKDGRYALVIEKDLAVRKAIKTGLESYDSTEIISGLKEGDVVVENNLSKIKNGMKVKAAKK